MPITVDLYPDAPYLDAQVVKGKKNIWRLDVLNGSHTAVTFNDAGKVKLRPQAGNVIPFEPELWVDRDPASKKRTIYFYCQRERAAKKDSVCLIETPDIKGDAPLQVWSRHHDKRYVYIKLNGNVLVLNGHGMKPVRPYRFPKQENIPQTAEPEKIIELVAKQGRLDHLVLNAHGFFAKTGNPGGTCLLGGGFDRSNLDLWDRLKGKVKYIWTMSCKLANDPILCGTIAQKTSAWFSSPWWSTEMPPLSLPAGHIEFFDEPKVFHWNGSLFRAGEKRFQSHEPDDFFRSARISPSKPSLDEDGLYFNIVQLGPKLPGKT
jgi:hypothetical protein